MTYNWGDLYQAGNQGWKGELDNADLVACYIHEMTPGEKEICENVKRQLHLNSDFDLHIDKGVITLYVKAKWKKWGKLTDAAKPIIHVDLSSPKSIDTLRAAYISSISRT